MLFLEAVHVDREGELLMGLEGVEFALEEKRVGAKVDVAALLDEAVDDGVNFRMDEGLAASDADDGSTAFLGGGQSLLGRDALFENVLGILDFATAFALQIATKKGLEHEHERITLNAFELLPNDVSTNFEGLGDRNGHVGWNIFENE